jgi:hypothetical protein
VKKCVDLLVGDIESMLDRDVKDGKAKYSSNFTIFYDYPVELLSAYNIEIDSFLNRVKEVLNSGKRFCIGDIKYKKCVKRYVSPFNMQIKGIVVTDIKEIS